MALNLLLLSFTRTWLTLEGQIDIYSGCLGALHKVEHLPLVKIPSKCFHSDILKNIMLHCNNLSFKRVFSHVKAHQDDDADFADLERPAQLSTGCHNGAIKKLLAMAMEDLPSQQAFPLEPLSIFVGGNILTTESGTEIRFNAQLQEAKAVFAEKKVLQPAKFDLVDWHNVHKTLHNIPTLFRVFACKQVLMNPPHSKNLCKRKDPSVSSSICPFCTQHFKTSGHILLCPEEGRVNLLFKYSRDLMAWILEMDLPRDLVF